MEQFPLATFAWLFVLAIILLNIGIAHWRAKALIASGRLSVDELNDFTRGAVVASSTYCLLLAAIQFASHVRDPFCLTQFPPKGPFGAATWVVMAGGMVLLLKWLWQGRGADVLARIAPALTRGSVTARFFTPRQVKLFVTAIVALAIVGSVAMQLAVPGLNPVCRDAAAA